MSGPRSQRSKNGPFDPYGGTWPEDMDKSEPASFDMGVFWTLAKYYGDETYMKLTQSLLEKASPVSPLQSKLMPQVRFNKAPLRVEQVTERNLPVAWPQDPRRLGLDPEKAVAFSLPIVEESGEVVMSLPTFCLPTSKDKLSYEGRQALFQFIDRSGVGDLRPMDVIGGLVQITRIPGVVHTRPLLQQTVDCAFHAVQDLMLGGPGSKQVRDAVSQREFRVLLIFIQRFLEIYETFSSIDDSLDNMLTFDEFVSALPKLKEWGIDDGTNPETVFRRIDADGSGYVTYREFADYAVRLGLVDEVEQDLRHGR